MSEDDPKEPPQMSASEQAIIEMLKRNHLEGLPRQENRHAFWDTQVSVR
jgi:hypothetical protein